MVHNYGNPWFLLYSLWINKHKVIKFSTYCNRSVCVCVCLLKHRLSASSFPNLKNHIAKLTPNFLYGFSAPPGRQCNTLCISGFVEDVVVSDNRPSRRMHSFYRAMLCIRGTTLFDRRQQRYSLTVLQQALCSVWLDVLNRTCLTETTWNNLWLFYAAKKQNKHIFRKRLQSCINNLPFTVRFLLNCIFLKNVKKQNHP